MKMKSSSSSLSFGSKTHNFGCISLILQRFICSGTASTYPSDQITELHFNSPDFSSSPLIDRGNQPGAVARLMGLDAFPIFDKNRVVSRSRSVNSVDYVKRDNDAIQEKHRRVKSSLNSYQFLEYVELEDDKFFILSFEKDLGELKQLGTRKCNKKRERREKQKETENQTPVEDKENNFNDMNVSPRRERLEIGEIKQRRKQKRNDRRKIREIKLRQNIEKGNWIERYGWSRDFKNEEEESGSCDDLSPVSVLDYDRFVVARATPSPGNSSTKHLSSELEFGKRNETVQEDHITLTSRTNVQGYNYQMMWLMVCRLTLSEIEESNWVHGKASTLEDLEGTISDDIVSNILDQLLEETITTLSLTSQV